jgi:tetratricopeptide (TPR) repeat protein
MGDPAGAIPHFRRLLELMPEDRAARANLATALVATDALDEALPLCAGGGDLKLVRLAAYIHQRQGRLAEAASGYGEVVAAAPDDFESWNNLGNVRSANGDVDGAIDAFERAINLRRDAIPIYLNLSELLAQAGREAARRHVMREAGQVAPRDPQVQTELGLAEVAARDYPAAERAFVEAIRLSDGFTPAYLELGLLLENLNRVDELAGLVDMAKQRGVAEAELDFIRAWALRRQGKFAEALPLAEATPPTINPVRRAHLIAELRERAGDTDGAFAAFVEMNRASVEASPAPPGRSYRDHVIADAALVTADRIAAWAPIEIAASPPAPVFIVGFPRSGTTLLDTLLMNLAGLQVLEELPALYEVGNALGSDARLAGLAPEEANALRARYFELVETLSGPREGRTIIDKHPLHMARMPLVHRLFPGAKTVLVERHPCDAVLSCFMANFQINGAMRSFTDLEEAARTYDAVFDAWTRAETLLPIDVHRIRYERMVADLEGEMRGLLAFLGLPWDDKVLDNRASASRRDHVRTASYSQITEPIYTRASGRWQRYRAHLEPVLPILAPWAERMGYEI